MTDGQQRAPGLTPQQAERVFAGRYGRPPELQVTAPGRVNLIGEHTDYNGGFVLPMAIDRQALMLGAFSAERPARLQIRSANLDHELTLPLAALTAQGRADDLSRALAQAGPSGRWGRYVAGVIAEFCPEGSSTLPSLDVLVTSDVPLGGGLSSSAALEVATATLLEAASGVVLEPLAKARVCQRAEQRWAGVPCGIMDQLISVAGQPDRALLIDCQALSWRAVALPAEAAWLVADCGVRHALDDGAYARRAEECARAARLLGAASLRDVSADRLAARAADVPPDLLRRARHVVTENARTLQASQVLAAGDLPALGALLYDSHRSLRDDFQVSCPALDALVDAAADIGPDGGVLGARLTGGGFGGSTITLVRRERVAAVAAALAAGLARRTGRSTVPLEVRPSAGARAQRLAPKGPPA